MALKLITPAPVEPVTSDEVKASARVDFDDEDAVLDSLIAAAREHVDFSDQAFARLTEVVGEKIAAMHNRPELRAMLVDRALVARAAPKGTVH